MSINHHLAWNIQMSLKYEVTKTAGFSEGITVICTLDCSLSTHELNSSMHCIHPYMAPQKACVTPTVAS